MKLANVGEVAEQIRGVTYKKSDARISPEPGFSPVLRAGNIGEFGLQFDDLVFVPDERISDAQRVRENDVVIATSSGSLSVVGKAARATEDFDGGFGAFCKVLRPGPEVDPAYFGQFFKTRGYRRRVSELAAGANINNLRVGHLDDLQIPLPPLPEQKRIAAILDAADALRAKRRESLEQLDELVQSVFLDMFGDPVTNPKGWETGVMEDLLDSTNYGTSKKASVDQREFPVLRMGNMSYSGSWDFSDMKYVDLDEREQQKYLVHRGQILFNRTNSKELVGKTAVYREDTPVAFAGYLIRGIVAKRADPEFVGTFMNIPQTKQYLQNLCRNIVGMANINAREFRSIPVIMPPLPDQRQFAGVVRAVLAQKGRLQSHLAELDTLFASLQSRAFRGEL